MAIRERGGKIFVAYLTAGLPDPARFLSLVQEISPYVDAIEVGLPFSDPIMDGIVIQQASAAALRAGISAKRCLDLVTEARGRAACPLLIMSYYNPIHRMGEAGFVEAAASAGVAGMIVPDLPLESSGPLGRALTDRQIALVQMVAPTTSPGRATQLARASRGFIYAVSRLGVTGERGSLEDAAAEVIDRIGPSPSIPVLLGIGIGSGEQASAASSLADGVIVGSALVRRVLDGDLKGTVALAAEIRSSI